MLGNCSQWALQKRLGPRKETFVIYEIKGKLMWYISSINPTIPNIFWKGLGFFFHILPINSQKLVNNGSCFIFTVRSCKVPSFFFKLFSEPLAHWKTYLKHNICLHFYFVWQAHTRDITFIVPFFHIVNWRLHIVSGNKSKSINSQIKTSEEDWIYQMRILFVEFYLA